MRFGFIATLLTHTILFIKFPLAETASTKTLDQSVHHIPFIKNSSKNLSTRDISKEIYKTGEYFTDSEALNSIIVNSDRPYILSAFSEKEELLYKFKWPLNWIEGYENFHNSVIIPVIGTRSYHFQWLEHLSKKTCKTDSLLINTENKIYRVLIDSENDISILTKNNRFIGIKATKKSRLTIFKNRIYRIIISPIIELLYNLILRPISWIYRTVVISLKRSISTLGRFLIPQSMRISNPKFRYLSRCLNSIERFSRIIDYYLSFSYAFRLGRSLGENLVNLKVLTGNAVKFIFYESVVQTKKHLFEYSKNIRISSVLRPKINKPLELSDSVYEPPISHQSKSLKMVNGLKLIGSTIIYLICGFFKICKSILFSLPFKIFYVLILILIIIEVLGYQYLKRKKRY